MYCYTDLSHVTQILKATSPHALKMLKEEVREERASQLKRLQIPIIAFLDRQAAASAQRRAAPRKTVTFNKQATVRQYRRLSDSPLEPAAAKVLQDAAPVFHKTKYIEASPSKEACARKRPVKRAPKKRVTMQATKKRVIKRASKRRAAAMQADILNS